MSLGKSLIIRHISESWFVGTWQPTSDSSSNNPSDEFARKEQRLRAQIASFRSVRSSTSFLKQTFDPFNCTKRFSKSSTWVELLSISFKQKEGKYYMLKKKKKKLDWSVKEQREERKREKKKIQNKNTCQCQHLMAWLVETTKKKENEILKCAFPQNLNTNKSNTLTHFVLTPSKY